MQDNRPIYIQIADRLADEILSGRYRPEERIPAVREVAADAQVNVNTVVRSFEQLERQGVIFNRRGLGYFVTPEACKKITQARHEAIFSGGELNYFFSRISSAGISADQLKELYNSFILNQ